MMVAPGGGDPRPGARDADDAAPSAAQAPAPAADPGAEASQALRREEVEMDYAGGTLDSGASVLDMSSEELDALRRNEQALLQRLTDMARSNRDLSSADADVIKNALEADMVKFAGPDIYERNTYREKINKQALLSRVRKDQLYWLYQQAEEALSRHASEVSHIPLAQFKIPTSSQTHSADQPNIDVGSLHAAPPSTYDNIASYFSQVKEHLASRGHEPAAHGWDGRPSTTAGGDGAAEEMRRLSSRFPSLAQRSVASRPSTVGADARRNREANTREGRTTHAADISNAASSAWFGGSSESFLYSQENLAAVDTSRRAGPADCGHPMHSALSCPECGSADNIMEMEVPDGAGSLGALTAVNLNRLREKAEEPSKYHLETVDGEEEPSVLSKAEQKAEFRRATFGGGGAAGLNSRQHGRPVSGLTPGVLRPSAAPSALPPLDTTMQLSAIDGASMSQSGNFSEFTDASSHDRPKATSRRRRRRRAWKSPYRPVSEGEEPVHRVPRTKPSFGGGGDVSDVTMDGAGLRVPPHLLDMIAGVEALLDTGDVEAALDHIASSFVTGNG